ncbi:DUF3152 domain-containing protein [Naumannella halotolerans]|uniref:DUF3152 domain-containing protein n=1 Tax=Naumannella halotolerans TaxID=993414 RepID=UPI00370DD56E
MTGDLGRGPRPSARRLRQRRTEGRPRPARRSPAVIRQVREGDPRRLRIAAVSACLLALVVPLVLAGRFLGDDDPTGAEPVTGTAAPEPPPAQASEPGEPTNTPEAAAASAELVVPEDGPEEWTVAEFSQDSPRDGGRTVRVQVRVEETVPVDAEEAAEEAAGILHDDRSWEESEGVRFEFVGTADADLTINIATPGTTDALCLPAVTGGELSCRNGDRVALNAKRWLSGVEAYGDDLTGYRRYLVNHEVGHYLGHGHVDCPGKGERAPLMMQQTKGVGECEPYPWPN